MKDKTNWSDRFDELFDEAYLSGEPKLTMQNCGLSVKIKNFISEELDKARKEERKRLKEKLPEKRFPCGCKVWTTVCNDNTCLGKDKEYGDGWNDCLIAIEETFNKEEE